jgi:hypothetical protein
VEGGRKDIVQGGVSLTPRTGDEDMNADDVESVCIFCLSK